MKFIIIGAGDVGVSLAEKLSHSNQDVILIEKNEHNISRIPQHVDAQIVTGNGCCPKLLSNANIENTDYIIAVADNDEVNISACLMAKLLNPKVKRIARIRHLNLEESTISKDALDDFFDLIINPDQAGADNLFRLFQVPGASDLVQFVNGKLNVFGITIKENAPCNNITIKEIPFLFDSKPILIIAILRNQQLIVPHGEDKIEINDIVYAATLPKYTNDLFKFAGHIIKENRSAIVWGGTILGHFVTSQLQAAGVDVKIILKEEDLNDEILDKYINCLVLQGEGTDQRLLEEESVSTTDAFIAASEHEEDNVLASLLAKKLGAKKAMALVNKRTYMDLVTTIGVDAVVSTQMSAASAIFRHIHPEAIFSESALNAYDTNFIEVTISPQIPYVGKLIKELELPTSVLIVAIIRKGIVIIPRGTDIIEAYDSIVIFSNKKQLKKLSKTLEIKLEINS